MTIIPPGRADMLNFFIAHATIWAEAGGGDPAAIGLTPAQLASLQDDVAAARAAFLEAEEARNAARSATLASNLALDRLRGNGAALIAVIKSFARVNGGDEGENGVLAEAALPVPSTSRAPLPAPEKPGTPELSIDAVGELTIRWSAASSGPSTGIYFEVERRDGDEGGDHAYTLIGAPAQTEFRDDLTRLTRAKASYRVRAVRGRTASAWAGPVLVDIVPRERVAAGAGGPGLVNGAVRQRAAA